MKNNTTYTRKLINKTARFLNEAVSPVNIPAFADKFFPGMKFKLVKMTQSRNLNYETDWELDFDVHIYQNNQELYSGNLTLDDLKRKDKNPTVSLENASKEAMLSLLGETQVKDIIKTLKSGPIIVRVETDKNDSCEYKIFL